MLGKRIIIPVLVVLLLFAGLLSARADDNKTSADLSDSRKAEVVQSQKALDAKKDSGETADRTSDLSINQNMMNLQKDDSLIDKRLLEPKTVQTSELSDKAASANTTAATVSRGGSRENRVLTMVATGYDGCYECNKPYYGQPSYTGLPLERGIVAVDPQIIPMGTRLYVEGYGEAIAADQGNAIKGNRIDLFFDSHQEALNFGKKTVQVTIL